MLNVKINGICIPINFVLFAYEVIFRCGMEKKISNIAIVRKASYIFCGNTYDLKTCKELIEYIENYWKFFSDPINRTMLEQIV